MPASRAGWAEEWGDNMGRHCCRAAAERLLVGSVLSCYAAGVGALKEEEKLL